MDNVKVLSTMDELKGSYSPVITTLAQGYTNYAFIGHNFLPDVTVPVMTGQYPKFDDYVFNLYDAEVGLDSIIKAIEDPKMDTGSFALKFRALEAQIDFMKKQAVKEGKFGSMLDLQKEALERVMAGMQLIEEKKKIDLLTNDANHDPNNILALTAANDRWDNANSDPIEQILDMMTTIENIVHKRPNVIGLSMKSFDTLRKNQKIIDRLATTKDQKITKKFIEYLLTDDEDDPERKVNIIISKAKFRSTKNATPSVMWADDVIVGAYVNQSKAAQRSHLIPSLGYNLTHKDFNTRGYKREAGQYKGMGDAVAVLKMYESVLSSNKCMFKIKDIYTP